MVRGKQRRRRSGKEDRISSLPDCLLIEIIFRLPETKYAIRTGTLSKRWQHLWRQQLSNIIIIDGGALDDYSQFYSSIERVISYSNNPLNKFTLHAYYNIDSEGYYSDKSQIDDCIWKAITHKVQHFDFDMALLSYMLQYDNGFVLPDFFFTCSSFIHLTLGGCSFEEAVDDDYYYDDDDDDDDDDDVISWENLRTLNIQDAELNQHLIQNILSGTPLLETFELGSCYGFERLDVTNKSVKKLALIGDLHGVVEINAPYILSLAFKGELVLRKGVLLNVSSEIEAELDYSKCPLDQPEEKQEEVLQGLIQSLGHVKEVKIGKTCSKVFTRLKAKGLIFPSNIKCPDEDED